MTATEVVIDRRFQGPPQSAHGGYTAGILAAMMTGVVEVNLRSPPPLERRLRIHGTGNEFHLLDRTNVVADARPAVLAVELPSSETVQDAIPMMDERAGSFIHPVPMCFGCGPQRDIGDGLRLLPVALDDSLIACPWRPGPGFADGDGLVLPQFVWAALDCPTAFALRSSRPLLLARITGRVIRSVEAQHAYLLLAWPVAHEGRKHEAVSVLFDLSGEPRAAASTLWIESRKSDLPAP